MKKEQKSSVTAIIFYVFAVLFLAYTAFSIFTAYQYVATYIEQGSITYAKDFKDILALYMQQAGPYLVYSLLLYAAGYVIDVVTKIKANMELGNVTKSIVEQNDEEFLAEIKETATVTTPVKKETPKAEKPKKDEVKKETKKETKPKAEKPAKTKTKAVTKTVKEEPKEVVSEVVVEEIKEEVK